MDSVTPSSKLDYFSTLNNLSIASEISNEISKVEYNQENYTVDFSIKSGKMSCSKNWNTCVKFDVTDSKHFKELVSIISSDEIDVTQDIIEKFEESRKLIGKELCTTFNKELSKVFLNRIFNIESNNVLPMKCIELDISDKPDIDYVLVVSKMTPPGVQSEPVTEVIFKIHTETGKDPEDIIKEFKENNDERFKYVTSCEKKKHFFEVSAYFMVDYSKLANI